MKIAIITPAPPHTRFGNRVTAMRWAGMLKSLGHRVTIAQEYAGSKADLLLALHAKRSYSSVKRFHREHPDKPLIVALTGTDLYRDLKASRHARQSLELATRIIVLQPEALKELPKPWQDKTRVIYQSASPASIRIRHPPSAITSPFASSVTCAPSKIRFAQQWRRGCYRRHHGFGFCTSARR